MIAVCDSGVLFAIQVCDSGVLFAIQVCDSGMSVSYTHLTLPTNREV